MIQLQAGRVRRVRAAPGRLELEVEGLAGPGSEGGLHAAHWPVVAYPHLGPFRWEPGQAVWVNTTAAALGLGSAGYHFALAPAVVDGPLPPKRSGPGWQPQGSARHGPGAAFAADWRALRRQGHILKLRYTPLQFAVRACEEPGAPYHRALRRHVSLGGLPVGVLSLHSMLGPVAAAFKLAAGCGDEARLAYVMTDSAALAAPVSRLLDRLVRLKLVDLVITCGQAFGGHLEAVHPASALAACARSGATAALVGPGPGVVGTATLLGTTCLEVALLADLAGALGARPAVPLRLSFTDRRVRHGGVSHHLLTAMGSLARCAATLILPASLSRGQRARVLGQLAGCGVLGRHRLVLARPMPAQLVLERLGGDWESMGRTATREPAFFDACTAAGRWLACAAGDALP